MGARRPCGVSCKRVMAGPVRGAAGPWALDLLRALPRVSLANLRPNPGSRKPVRLGMARESEALRERGACEPLLLSDARSLPR